MGVARGSLCFIAISLFFAIQCDCVYSSPASPSKMPFEVEKENATDETLSASKDGIFAGTFKNGTHKVNYYDQDRTNFIQNGTSRLPQAAARKGDNIVKNYITSPIGKLIIALIFLSLGCCCCCASFCKDDSEQNENESESLWSADQETEL